MAAAAAEGVVLNHIARASPAVKRLAAFYQEVQVLGFERIDTPKFGEFEVIRLRFPPSFSLHLVEKDPKSKLSPKYHRLFLIQAPASRGDATSALASPTMIL